MLGWGKGTVFGLDGQMGHRIQRGYDAQITRLDNNGPDRLQRTLAATGKNNAVTRLAVAEDPRHGQGRWVTAQLLWN